jgi:hypothetical protein
MVEMQTWWQVFRGAQAIGQRAGLGHWHPRYYGECVFCECCNLIHAAALESLARQEKKRV